MREMYLYDTSPHFRGSQEAGTCELSENPTVQQLNIVLLTFYLVNKKE